MDHALLSYAKLETSCAIKRLTNYTDGSAPQAQVSINFLRDDVLGLFAVSQFLQGFPLLRHCLPQSFSRRKIISMACCRIPGCEILSRTPKA